MPFGFEKREKEKFAASLEANGFEFFKVNDLKQQEDIYGEEIVVESQELEQYFLPYTEHILFPLSLKEEGFHRFTCYFGQSFNLHVDQSTIPFTVQSIDIILGPFGFAFLTIRVSVSNMERDLAEILNFAHHFRTVEAKLDEEQGAYISHQKHGGQLSVNDLIFKRLCPFLEDYLLQDEKLNRYFGTLPYFVDERMLVTGFLFSTGEKAIKEEQLYRMAAVDGRTSDGDIFISANNPAYIHRFLKKHLHDRWAPNTYTVVSAYAFMTITTERPEKINRMLSQFMGTHYYNFLLHYFYKTALLRVAYEYSKIDWDKDEEYVKSLIKFINLFSSLYYNQEVSTRSEGKELTAMFRHAFQIESHFNKVSKTLHELYKSQENLAANRMNMLLFVLTIFTVISGIYGMNLVIEDWETPSGWKDFVSYTFFEWISLITAVMGIGLSGYLVATTFSKMLRNKLRKNKTKNQMD